MMKFKYTLFIKKWIKRIHTFFSPPIKHATAEKRVFKQAQIWILTKGLKLRKKLIIT